MMTHHPAHRHLFLRPPRLAACLERKRQVVQEGHAWGTLVVSLTMMQRETLVQRRTATSGVCLIEGGMHGMLETQAWICEPVATGQPEAAH